MALPNFIINIKMNISEDTTTDDGSSEITTHPPEHLVCNQQIAYGSITYFWPETPAGSNTTFICPNNPDFSVTRECSIEGLWLDFDEIGCGVLAEQLEDLNINVMFYFTFYLIIIIL